MQPPVIAAPPSAVLSASATQTPDPVLAGDNVSIVVETQNLGLTTAAGVRVRIQLPFGLDPILPTPSGCVVDTDLLERWILCDRSLIAGQTTDILTVELSTPIALTSGTVVSYGVAQNGGFPPLDQQLVLDVEERE